MTFFQEKACLANRNTANHIEQRCADDFLAQVLALSGQPIAAPSSTAT